MTRKSKREIERTVENLAEAQRVDDDAGGKTVEIVYRDPVTNKLFQGRGEDAAPVENVAADTMLVVLPRTLCMDRDQAERDGREILEVANENTGAVLVRIEPAADVAVEDAVVRPPDSETEIDFSGVDT